MPSSRIINPELVGVWSANARFGLGAQADEIVVFKPDGTGWLEVLNGFPCSADFFEWTLTSPGWVALAGTKSLTLDVKTDKLIDSQDLMEVKHLPYQVQEEHTPSGKVMQVLRIELLNFGKGAFGFLEINPESYTEPRNHRGSRVHKRQNKALNLTSSSFARFSLFRRRARLDR
ncbi:hypothetical protein JOY44_19495 [Phormidium sp. CLA17]|uniref:hypothetical protein n=1 Tax=Leptolyngbya sp. Cla-17 TaxID=2803751 RepID=UPI00149252F3|nr:hypothetical protein [Leptolyngbya sp. Cla-17]MBM0743776.1 hypothetical protein [Leptolyngbya sp. Cla-17]